MNRTSSIPSLSWMKVSAPVRKTALQLLLGLAALALVVGGVLVAAFGFESIMSDGSAALIEARADHWDALAEAYGVSSIGGSPDASSAPYASLAAHYVPECGSIGGITQRVASAAKNHPSAAGSALARHAQMGLGRTDPLGGYVSAPSVALQAKPYARVDGRAREGIIVSGLAGSGQTGLGHIDSLARHVSASSVALSAAHDGRGPEGTIDSGLAAGGQTGLSGGKVIGKGRPGTTGSALARSAQTGLGRMDFSPRGRLAAPSTAGAVALAEPNGREY